MVGEPSQIPARRDDGYVGRLGRTGRGFKHEDVVIVAFNQRFDLIADQDVMRGGLKA